MKEEDKITLLYYVSLNWQKCPCHVCWLDKNTPLSNGG